jgi:hypothetical protein
MMTKNMIIKLAVVGLSLLVGFGFIVGCSSMEPYDYQNEADEMKPGPGLLTGEDGEAVLFRIPADSKEKPQETTTEEATKEAPESERMIQP